MKCFRRQHARGDAAFSVLVLLCNLFLGTF